MGEKSLNKRQYSLLLGLAALEIGTIRQTTFPSWLVTKPSLQELSSLAESHGRSTAESSCLNPKLSVSRGALSFPAPAPPRTLAGEAREIPALNHLTRPSILHMVFMISSASWSYCHLLFSKGFTDVRFVCSPKLNIAGSLYNIIYSAVVPKGPGIVEGWERFLR